jgi:Coenzyme PQQ synthesis protein D (PqqD)
VKRYRLREEGLSWRRIEDEVVAVDVGTSTYVSANDSGTVLWEALTEGATRDELAALLADRFDLAPAAAAEDVDGFLAQLEAQGLLAEA